MKRSLLPLFVLVILLVGCADEQSNPVEPPVEYGNDGAVLKKIDLEGAVGLVAVLDIEHSYDYSPAWTFVRATLKKISADGTLAQASFEIEGQPNGGFDDYLVNTINDRYFLISFYRRKESYVIDKHNGQSVKTHFTPASQLSSVTINNQWFYQDNVRHKLYHVDNFLLATDARRTDRAVDARMTELYADAQEELYVKRDDQLLHVDKDLAQMTAFTANSVALWRDGDGNLKTLLRDGKMYGLSAAEASYMSYEKDLGMTVTTWANTIPFELAGQNKQFLLFTDAAAGTTHLFDLVENKSAVDLTDKGTVLTTYGAAILDQTIFLFQANAQTQRLVTIHTGDLTVEKVNVSMTASAYGKFYALTPSLSVVEAYAADGACTLKTIDATGKVADLSGQPIQGPVIPL
jgi:hypothetical protein